MGVSGLLQRLELEDRLLLRWGLVGLKAAGSVRATAGCFSLASAQQLPPAELSMTLPMLCGFAMEFCQLWLDLS
ncbi:MAG: hypothetical protein ERJ67_11055 [Aphanocapsa feldmannii 277cV]|uniref:Uncharacterized protein n=1 Tax=Aphanocapsa feldmannii 277cV TaxID=2507553 RepID=A0A524RKN0_9CHRO|nr:MAG: hypothetical protein ERJ67_11055 [Aphanocapsa feldmannii 277cV]